MSVLDGFWSACFYPSLPWYDLANSWVFCSCEREKKWLEEDRYAIDSSIVPRGGARRLKSMEPQALGNVNGTLVPIGEASRRGCSSADWGSVQNFTKHYCSPSAALNNNNQAFPLTPGGKDYDFSRLDEYIAMSPAKTPLFLSQRADLVQQTCPPKRTYRGLFSPTDDDDESSERLRAKLETVRRKTSVFNK